MDEYVLRLGTLDPTSYWHPKKVISLSCVFPANNTSTSFCGRHWQSNYLYQISVSPPTVLGGEGKWLDLLEEPLGTELSCCLSLFEVCGLRGEHVTRETGPTWGEAVGGLLQSLGAGAGCRSCDQRVFCPRCCSGSYRAAWWMSDCHDFVMMHWWHKTFPECSVGAPVWEIHCGISQDLAFITYFKAILNLPLLFLFYFWLLHLAWGDLTSLIRDGTWGPCSGSLESLQLDCQGSPPSLPF